MARHRASQLVGNKRWKFSIVLLSQARSRARCLSRSRSRYLSFLKSTGTAIGLRLRQNKAIGCLWPWYTINSKSISIRALSSLSPVSRPAGHQNIRNIRNKNSDRLSSLPAFFTLRGRSALEFSWRLSPFGPKPGFSGSSQVRTLSASLLSSPSRRETMMTSKCKGFITPNHGSVLLLLSRFRGSSSSSSSSWNEWKLISWSSKSHQIMEAEAKVLPFWEVPCLLLRTPISFLFLLSVNAK